MNFKDPERLKKEFWEIEPKLRMILCDIEQWSLTRGEDVVVTCLIRTEDEQRSLVEAGQALDKVSVHMYGRGADLRLFKNNNLNLIIGEYINTKYVYDYARPKMKTLITHGGTAQHHHIQCLPGERV